MKWKMKNKNGSVLIYGLMLGLVIIVLALALAPAIVESTTRARNQTSGDAIGLSCDNETISNFDKAACVATDLTILYFVGALIFIGGAVVTAKFLF